MVGKLMKYELKAILRVLFFVGAGVLLTAVLARIFMASESGIGFLFVFMALYVSIILIFASFVVSCQRFNRSLFYGEGYMTFSLPVSETQLIVSKLLSAIIATFFGVIIFFVSWVIVLSGMQAEDGQLFEEFRLIFEQVSAIAQSDPLLIVEWILTLIVMIPMYLLFVYCAMSLGQLSTKFRKWLGVVVGFAAFIVLSILNGYCLLPLLDLAGTVSPHLSSWIQIILYAGFDVGLFFVIRYVLKYRLNLVG